MQNTWSNRVHVLHKRPGRGTILHTRRTPEFKHKRFRKMAYNEIKLNHGYRIDLLVEDKVVVEIKTVEAFTDVHSAQVLTYLRLGNYKLGLLLNFHVTMLKHGIKRIIN